MTISEYLMQYGVVRVPILDRDEAQQLLALSVTFYDWVAAKTELAELRSEWALWAGLGFSYLLALPETPETKLFGELVGRVCTRVSDLFGEYRFLPEKSYFRRAAIDTSSAVDWHCDAEAASMMSYGRDCITAWIPLEPVGLTLPSLEFVVGSNAILSEQSTHLMLSQNRPDDWVEELPGERMVPHINDLELGKAIVFSQYTLHRTQKLKVDRSRTNCELRFTHA